MRAALHPAPSHAMPHRSLDLQEYDEARAASSTAAAAAAAPPPTPSRTSTRQAACPPSGSGTPAAAGDDAAASPWTLCGWLEEPSVPPAARAASAKLLRSALQPLPVASKDGRTRPASRPGPPASSSSSPRKHAAAASPLRARAARQQAAAATCRQHPHNQLGEEDSFEAGHFRPAGADTQAGSSADAQPAEHTLHLPPVACPAAGECSSNSGSSSRCATPQASAAAAASGLGDSSPARASSPPAAGVASPRQCEPATLPALATPAPGLCNQQPASVYSNSSVGGIEPGLFGASSRLRSSSSVRVSSSDASVVALQHRLLLHSNSTGGCSLQSGRWAAQLMLPAGGLAPAAGSGSAAAAATAASGGGGTAGAGALSLHARMAATAARAQLLLTRDHLGHRLHRSVPPPPPATQPSIGGALVQPGADCSSGLRFGASRSGTASRGSGADAAARPCSAATCQRCPVSANSSPPGVQRRSGSCGGAVGASRRPSSASSSSSSHSGASAVDAGWRERPQKASSQLLQARGLAGAGAAAEYTATCQATVSDLLQHINSRGGASTTVGPAVAPPRCDIVRSRDKQATVAGRAPSSLQQQQQQEPPPLVCESRGLSLKACEAFQASLASSSSSSSKRR